jgi:hypothetical protein
MSKMRITGEKCCHTPAQPPRREVAASHWQPNGNNAFAEFMGGDPLNVTV